MQTSYWIAEVAAAICATDQAAAFVSIDTMQSYSGKVVNTARSGGRQNGAR
jgi:hypothetical protein